jgi:hypothetical protein
MNALQLPAAQLALAIVIAVLLLAGGILGYRQWRRSRARRQRLQQVSAAAFDMVQDVLVPDGSEGHLHVDFLLLTAAGIVVVDLRDVPGMIFGSESMDEWTAMDGTRRVTFVNPLGPLYDRMAAVKLAAGKVPVDGRVVFSASGRFPKGRPPRVTSLDALGGEFGVADRTLEPSPVAAWSEEWAAVKAVLQPSPHRRKG